MVAGSLLLAEESHFIEICIAEDSCLFCIYLECAMYYLNKFAIYLGFVDLLIGVIPCSSEYFVDFKWLFNF